MTKAFVNCRVLAGERFLAVSGDFMLIVQMARVLKARLGSAARRVPTIQLPNMTHLARIAAGGAVVVTTLYFLAR